MDMTVHLVRQVSQDATGQKEKEEEMELQVSLVLKEHLECRDFLE